MSNVLEFCPASAGASGARSSDTAPSGGSLRAAAQIIIFPGIRYERAVDTGEPSPTPSRGGRGRSARRSVK